MLSFSAAMLRSAARRAAPTPKLNSKVLSLVRKAPMPKINKTSTAPKKATTTVKRPLVMKKNSPINNKKKTANTRKVSTTATTNKKNKIVAASASSQKKKKTAVKKMTTTTEKKRVKKAVVSKSKKTATGVNKKKGFSKSSKKATKLSKKKKIVKKTVKPTKKKPATTKKAVSKKTSKSTPPVVQKQQLKALNTNVNVVTSFIPLLAATAGITDRAEALALAAEMSPSMELEGMLREFTTTESTDKIEEATTLATVTADDVDPMYASEAKEAAELSQSMEEFNSGGEVQAAIPLLTMQKSRLQATSLAHPAQSASSIALPMTAQSFALRGLGLPTTSTTTTTTTEAQTEQ